MWTTILSSAEGLVASVSGYLHPHRIDRRYCMTPPPRKEWRWSNRFWRRCEAGILGLSKRFQGWYNPSFLNIILQVGLTTTRLGIGILVPRNDKKLSKFGLMFRVIYHQGWRWNIVISQCRRISSQLKNKRCSVLRAQPRTTQKFANTNSTRVCIL
jgi:hypothetical protein